ncbi:MAG TPA: Pup--protein ligase [Actinomycetaceae bacterium]|nr:Pup--protein ligase [Actinomycetaceae bacterium]
MRPARRIYGLETEYGITIAGAREGTPAARTTAEEAARYLFRTVVERGRSTNVFLRNGGRLYLDVGSHPEYATAECDRPRDVVIQDRAGDELLLELSADADAQLAKEGIGGRIHLLKNNVDSEGQAFGSHENYLLRRRPNFAALVQQVVPFLVTRQILTGAGGLRTSAAGTHYCFSERSEHLWDAMSSATTRSRPIINSRDEPHADADKYRRLHVISGDSTIAEPTTLLKLGMTGLLLDALEAGVRLDDLLLAEPMRAIRDVSRDITATVRLELVSGRRLTPVEMQEEYLQRVQRHVSAMTLDADERYVLELWERGLRAVREAKPELVATELDWVIKKQLLDNYCARHATSLADVRVRRLLLAYHDISPDHGLARRLEERGLMRRLTTPEQVTRATIEPPQTTRAKLRGDFIAAAQDHRRDHTVDWIHLKLADSRHTTVMCKDPFANSDARVDDLIAAAARA